MKLTENQLKAMVAESIQRQLKEGWGDTVKNGINKVGRVIDNYVDSGEFKDPEAIKSPLEKWFYNHGWKMTKIGNGTYRCESLMGVFGKMPNGMTSSDKILAILQKSNPTKNITMENDPDFAGNGFGDKGDGRRVNYEYGSYSESFILRVTNR